MFALMMIPAIGLLACSIDYSRALSVRTALLAAADNANFAAIGTTTEGYNAAVQMTENGTVPLAQQDAQKFFDTQSGLVQGLTSVSRTVTVNKTAGTLTSTVSFTGQVKTSFASIMGFNNTTVSGTTSATNGIPIFMDFYLLLDDSPSMNVAATTADIATMVNNTPDQCAFACHEADKPGNDYYALAKKLGVTTRMDVLRQATQQLFTTAANKRSNPTQFGMATYTFDTALNTVGALTTDMTEASNDAANIQGMIVPAQNWNNDQDTNFVPAFDGINTIVPTPGTGASTNSRQKVVFFVSDGVSDWNNNGTRSYNPVPAALCNTLKNRGVQIAVLYTPYLPLPTNAWYNTYVAPLQPSVAPAMQACASPGFYFAVGPNQGITDAMNALFLKVIGQAHLTH